jgi:hypothetical protein
MTTYLGSCHCGRVTFEVDASPTKLSCCNCSICHAKGALYIPVGEIEVVRIISGESDITPYRFGTETAVHYFCRHCGIHTFHRPRLDPNRWSVNARCVEELRTSDLPIVEFDGQHWERSAREHGWSG